MATTPWQTHRILVPPHSAPPHATMLDREWLISNGTGAYAAGTAAGCNTRRYHGLLIASTHPPVGRILALNQMYEQLVLSRPPADDESPSLPISQPLEFSTCMFRQDEEPGRVMVPNGLKMLKEFTRGLHVGWVYQWGKITFRRTLYLHWKQQAVTLEYRITALEESRSTATLRLAPMLTLRDFHSLSRKADQPQYDIKNDKGVVTAALGDVAVTFACHCQKHKATFKQNEDWWYDIFYPLEAQRGQDDHEDYLLPGTFEIELEPGSEALVTLTAALGSKAVKPVADTTKRQAHLKAILTQLTPVVNGSDADEPGKQNLCQQLAIAADDFIVDRVAGQSTRQTILAGYPWFADWGRDTFIALPGLLLCTGRFEQAKAVLQTFARALNNGLVPNRFDDYDDTAAHYNTVDASLWFVHAAAQYVQTSGDDGAWEEWLADAAVSIVDAYIRGTDHDIAMTGDCLINAGSATTQLTWMDAACGEPGSAQRVVFTPRHGKAVEINTLWYNALVTLAAALPASYSGKADHYHRLAGRVKRSFSNVFWRDDLECLIDHVWTDPQGDRHPDYSIRPNQIFAAALPHSPLPRTKQLKVVQIVTRRLLTPVGLRTLPVDDPHYHGHYAGGPYQRDEAYHQGTIWPWLIGPYAEAILRTGKFSDSAKAQARQAIDPLLTRMLGPGLGQLHEIHEADPDTGGAHRPVGCFAQAWSVGEVIRVLRLIQTG